MKSLTTSEFALLDIYASRVGGGPSWFAEQMPAVRRILQDWPGVYEVVLTAVEQNIANPLMIPAAVYAALVPYPQVLAAIIGGLQDIAD